MYDTSKRLSMPLPDNYSPQIIPYDLWTKSEVKNHGRVSQIAGCTTIMAQFSSTSGLQDSLTYMYYTSKCLYMSLLDKYIQ